jgi:fumarate reductase flavoprotein subunit
MDQYTKSALAQGLSRRNFLSRAAAGAAGVGLLGATGLEAETQPVEELGKSSDGAATLSFLPKPRKIADKEISKTAEYDVVVVGAGASGVPAALSARENGATVAVVQKAPFALAQGNTGSGIDFEKTEKAGVEALVARIIADNNHRCNPALIRQWATNSGEAVSWVIDRARQAGSPVVDQGSGPQLKSINGYAVGWVTSYFGPKPYTAGDGMRHLAMTATKAGVEFFYNTRAYELLQNEKGDVIGVIARQRDGKYVRFMARKGVIMATGDYQNNKAMKEYFLPDLNHIGPKQIDKTGDGFIMVYWAGGVIEPIGHTKMSHDFDAGPASMCDMPFLAVNRSGRRFVNETVAMSLMNNYLKDAENAGHYAQIFDSDYMTRAANWPGKLVAPDALKNWMPEEPGPKKEVFPSFIATYKADTIEELAGKLEMDPSTLAATVKRYNELVTSGKDEDFGKPANLLVPVLKPPFYGIHRTVRISAICSGMVVDEQHRALKADGEPIKGLYVVGNLGGCFYGGIDYPLTVFGLSLGRCYTSGYLAGRQVAKL